MRVIPPETSGQRDAGRRSSTQLHPDPLIDRFSSDFGIVPDNTKQAGPEGPARALLISLLRQAYEQPRLLPPMIKAVKLLLTLGRIAFESMDPGKVLITGYKLKVMDERRRSNPEVVFRDKHAGCPQASTFTSICLRNVQVNRKQREL